VHSDFGNELVFPREYLRAALVVSLLSVWVLVGLFWYLNRYTRRRYFTIWMVAWLFYALWITLNFSLPDYDRNAFVVMLRQWCVGSAAVFMMWGSAHFLGQRAGQRLFGLFMAFVFIWSCIGAYNTTDDQMVVQIPIFSLLGFSSMLTGWGFYLFRKHHNYVGAGLLAWGFLMWGLYLFSYPVLQNSDHLISAGFFISAVLQLFIAVSMIVLVLEEVRTRNELALQEVRDAKTRTERLRKRAQSTEERFRSLFDQATEAIVIAAATDLQILEVNQAGRRVLGIQGLDGNAPCLSQFLKPVNPEIPPKTGTEWFALICQQRRIELVRRDGTTTPAEVDGAPINFEGQDAYQFFFREQTERGRLEQQLRQAEKLSALGQMISGIAHELNNPLTVIKGYLELILSKHELPPVTRTDLEKVATECNRAAKLVSNFLALSRQQPAEREIVNLNDLIRRVVELREFECRSAAIQIGLHLDPALPTTQVDPDQIQQVLVNLITNAMQALADRPVPRRISISSETRAGAIRIIVEDSGTGIPDAHVPHIFEPFFTTKEVGTGTGLGLSIAHSVMADHHGRIFYQHSTGGGACFVLEFPIRQGPLPPPPTSETTLLIASQVNAEKPQPATILIVDDEKSIAELLGEMLGILGHQATLRNSAPEALELLDEQDFDVIISDFRMPMMDGQAFYREATRMKPYLSKRFVFLSGDVINEETQDFLKSTGNPHMAKPFQLRKVEAVVAKLLQEQREEKAEGH
jgi:signal transduction histidine kinase